MNYQQFLAAITKEMQALVSGDESVTIHNVSKNNGIKMKALSVRREKQEVCPIIYMAPFYRMHLSGRRMEDIVREVFNLYRMDAGHLTDSRIFFQFHLAKPYLAYRIVNYEANRQILHQLPNRRMLDFAVIYYLSLTGKDGARGSALIYKDHMKSWGVTEEELYQEAFANTPVILPSRVEPLDHVLQGVLLEEEGKDLGTDRMYLITNPYNFYGAAAAFYPDVLKGLSGALGADLYLLPCSVHEFLALSVSQGLEEEKLRELVHSVNTTHVAPEEILSEHVYRYFRAEDRVTLV